MAVEDQRFSHGSERVGRQKRQCGYDQRRGRQEQTEKWSRRIERTGRPVVARLAGQRAGDREDHDQRAETPMRWPTKARSLLADPVRETL